MTTPLRIDPRDAVPIWRQIEQGVQRLVATGVMAAGESIPSVRDLSRELRVNPATVAKAYQRLADAGVLTVRRGEGTFVAEQPPAMSAPERRSVLAAAAGRYAAVAATLGASESEAVAALRDAWPVLPRGDGRGDGR
jgi:GntR family transcriptional regulator